MTIYAVFKVFGYIIGVAATPYTMTECVNSLAVMTAMPEIEGEYICVLSDTRPKLDTLPPRLRKIINRYIDNIRREV